MFSHVLRFGSMKPINFCEALGFDVIRMVVDNKSSSGLRILRDALQLLEKLNA